MRSVVLIEVNSLKAGVLPCAPRRAATAASVLATTGGASTIGGRASECACGIQTDGAASDEAEEESGDDPAALVNAAAATPNGAAPGRLVRLLLPTAEGTEGTNILGEFGSKDGSNAVAPLDIAAPSPPSERAVSQSVGVAPAGTSASVAVATSETGSPRAAAGTAGVAMPAGPLPMTDGAGSVVRRDAGRTVACAFLLLSPRGTARTSRGLSASSLVDSPGSTARDE